MASTMTSDTPDLSLTVNDEEDDDLGMYDFSALDLNNDDDDDVSSCSSTYIENEHNDVKEEEEATEDKRETAAAKDPEKRFPLSGSSDSDTSTCLDSSLYSSHSSRHCAPDAREERVIDDDDDGEENPGHPLSGEDEDFPEPRIPEPREDSAPKMPMRGALKKMASFKSNMTRSTTAPEPMRGLARSKSSTYDRMSSMRNVFPTNTCSSGMRNEQWTASPQQRLPARNMTSLSSQCASNHSSHGIASRRILPARSTSSRSSSVRNFFASGTTSGVAATLGNDDKKADENTRRLDRLDLLARTKSSTEIFPETLSGVDRTPSTGLADRRAALAREAPSERALPRRTKSAISASARSLGAKRTSMRSLFGITND